jgi:hypothetical protein
VRRAMLDKPGGWPCVSMSQLSRARQRQSKRGSRSTDLVEVQRAHWAAGDVWQFEQMGSEVVGCEAGIVWVGVERDGGMQQTISGER